MTECGCSEICRLDEWTDQFTPATRELMVFTKNPKRYFDLDAVREPYSRYSMKLHAGGTKSVQPGPKEDGPGGWMTESKLTHPGGAPPLDWWQIPSPKPSPVTEYRGAPMTATFHVGDAIEVMSKLPEKSVDLILTSPPFLALRSYLPADHPDKALEGGSQSTPGEYVDWLLDVAEACARVLAPHGSLCIELGDTYSGSGGAGGDYAENGLREGQPTFRQGKGNWPLPKSLALIPETFRFAMVYGRNPHTGRTTAPWRLRNVIRWVRPNPPVGALGDKFRPATSELMIFCKSAKRYFDLDAVREPFAEITLKNKVKPALNGPKAADYPGAHYAEAKMTHAGAPPLDWWNIPPGGYEGAHYAVFPPELCVKPVKAMSPEKVCRQCGEPSRRTVQADWSDVKPMYAGNGSQRGRNQPNPIKNKRARFNRNVTSGFSDCGHNSWRPGLILDPFAGSGTTLAVATGHGRDAIGIDLDERNYELALQRVGPFILERAS